MESNRVLELAQKAVTLYSAQISEEKRKQLNCVFKLHFCQWQIDDKLQKTL